MEDHSQVVHVDAEPAAPGGYHARIRLAKRQAAIDAAFALFLEVGYADTTLQQIAARAGISTATLFKRFPSKATLFEAIVMEVWSFDPPLAIQPAPGDVATGLKAIGHELAVRLRDTRMLGFYRVFIASLGRFPELGRVVLERGKLPFVGQVAALLAASGPFPGADVGHLAPVASQFVAMIADRLFWPRVLVHDLVLSDAERDDAVEQAVRTLLARLHWDPGAPPSTTIGNASTAVAQPGKRKLSQTAPAAGHCRPDPNAGGRHAR